MAAAPTLLVHAGMGLVLSLLALAWGCTGTVSEPPSRSRPCTGGSCVTPDGDSIAIPEVGPRRLTRYEYDNVIEDLLGDTTRPVRQRLRVESLTPFDNDYATQDIDEPLVDSLEFLATDVTHRLLCLDPTTGDPIAGCDTSRRDQVVGCAPAAADDAACMRSFVETFGRKVYRAPMPTEDVNAFVTEALVWAVREDDFYSGVELVLRTMLQDPQFLYRIERWRPLPDDPTVSALSPSEIATRLSFLLWGSTPDDALLDRVENDGLSTPESLRAAVDEMLRSDRARQHVDRFHAQWFGYAELPHSPELTQSLRQETAMLIERVLFDERGSWLDLFTADETWVDDRLAAHYGFPAPGTPRFMPYSDLPPEQHRMGLLSHGSFLSIGGAGLSDTSPTFRGKAIRELLMCAKIPAPPPEANADQSPSENTSECKWDTYAAHRNATGCASCHSLMDPIGFGLENYDLAGRYRSHDEGRPECGIDGQGQLAELGETFEGPAGLADVLIDHDLLGRCLSIHLFRYAMGTQDTAGDDAFISHLEGELTRTDYSFEELLYALVTSPAFTHRREVTEP